MTPADLRATIAALGLSNSAAGRLLGHPDGRKIRLWTAGTHRIPSEAERFLRYLAASRTPPARVAELLGE